MDQDPVCFVIVVNKVHPRLDPSLPPPFGKSSKSVRPLFSFVVPNLCWYRRLEEARRESRRLKSEREKHDHGYGKLEAHACFWENLAESSSSDEETYEKEH